MAVIFYVDHFLQASTTNIVLAFVVLTQDDNRDLCGTPIGAGMLRTNTLTCQRCMIE